MFHWPSWTYELCLGKTLERTFALPRLVGHFTHCCVNPTFSIFHLFLGLGALAHVFVPMYDVMLALHCRFWYPYLPLSCPCLPFCQSAICYLLFLIYSQHISTLMHSLIYIFDFYYFLIAVCLTHGPINIDKEVSRLTIYLKKDPKEVVLGDENILTENNDRDWFATLKHYNDHNLIPKYSHFPHL